jgi:hypothetical protein
MTKPTVPAHRPIDVEAIEREARRLRAEAIAAMWKALWARMARRGGSATTSNATQPL